MIRKRKPGKWKKWVALLGVCVIGGAVAFYFMGGGLPGGRESVGAGVGASGDTGASMGSYSAVSLGDLSVTVYGSGSLSAAETRTVYSGAAGKVESVLARVGDTVRAGDVVATLSSDDLEAELASLERELFAARQSLAAVRDAGNATSVYAPAAGRVKLIACAEDDDVSMVMKQTGYLCVISRDGKMKAVFEPSAGAKLSVGDTVSVQIGVETVAGVVDEVDGLGGRVAVTIDEDTYDVGQKVVISTTLGERVGEGELEINMPIPVTGIGGVIENVYKEDNDTVSSGATLFTLSGRIPSAALTEALLTYEEAKVNLENATADRDSLVLRAPIDGIVSAMNLTEGVAFQQDSAAFTVQSDAKFEVVATVDELDVINVSVGQTATVEMDAYSDRTFTGVVTRVSGVGTVSGGVATYEVTVLLDEAEGLMDGMTASLDIVVANRENVLLVPVEAISTSLGRNYVTLSTGETSAVEVGASDGTNTEILSGVSEGDRVLITRNGSSASSASGFGAMGGMAGGITGGIAGAGGGRSGSGSTSRGGGSAGGFMP